MTRKKDWPPAPRPRTLAEARRLIGGRFGKKLSYLPELSEQITAKEYDIDSIVSSYRERDGKIRDPSAIRELLCAIMTRELLVSVLSKYRRAKAGAPGARLELRVLVLEPNRRKTRPNGRRKAVR